MWRWCSESTGYSPDCDGSLIARLKQVDEHGEGTGWEPDDIGLYPITDVVLESPAELFALADGWFGSSAAQASRTTSPPFQLSALPTAQ
jgi:hypothetical protein